METLPLFPLQEFEQVEATAQPGEEEGRGSWTGERDVDGTPARTGDPGHQADWLGVEEEPEDPPASTKRAGGGQEGDPVYERTGLQGPFPLGSLALLFPDLAEDELASLALDIAANGLLEEITLAGDPPRIVDGKNRLRACERAGVNPSYRLLRKDIDPRDYVWARNGERRDLTKSQRAMAIAELLPFSGPGRPRTVDEKDENSAVLQNYGGRTMDRTARQGGFSARLLSDAARVADKNGPATPELRDAVRQGLVTVTGAANGTVLKAPQELQRQAVALVRNGEAKTVAAAVKRISENLTAPGDQKPSQLTPSLRFGERASFHHCSVEGLAGRIAPGSVDLIVASPPRSAGLPAFSDLATLAVRALTPEGLLVVAVLCRRRLPRILNRLQKTGLEWVIDLSLLFPAPVSVSDEPHRIGLRRVALLVFGKPGARLDLECDIIEVPPACADAGAQQASGIRGGLALAVQTLASPGQVVCDPIAGGRDGVAQAAVGAGCTFIGADQDQDRMHTVCRLLESGGYGDASI